MWKHVDLFEREVARIIGAPYGIATDCCTHAIFISLLWEKEHGLTEIGLPKRTYISVPQACRHLNLKIHYHNTPWKGSYDIIGSNVVDSACHFSENTYNEGFSHCLSFHHRKTLSTIRGGMILTDNKEFADWARLMIYDGRDRNKMMKDDNPTLCGYLYYMSPETAILGMQNLMKLDTYIQKSIATYKDYKDISHI